MARDARQAAAALPEKSVLPGSVLTNPFWNTRFGAWLLRTFWATWLGRWLTRKFGPGASPPGTPEEFHGYAYWGPVALAIIVIEVCGALSKTARNFFPWPTISGTVGHIQDLDDRWGLAVVFIVAVTAFYAVSSTKEADPPGTRPVVLGVRYGWPLVFVLTGLSALLVAILDRTDSSDLKKFHLGYAIYGAFGVFGIVIPGILVWRRSRHVVFPSLFFTLRLLRTRFRWLAAALSGGLAILLVHLALYPWPNLAREPASYAGLNGYHAKIKAEDAIRLAGSAAKDDLSYATESHGVDHGRSVWLVYFNVVVGMSSTDTGCVIEVTATDVTTLPAACTR